MENKNETLEITNNELEYDNLIDLKSTLQVELNDILDELSSIEEDREKLQNNQYLEEAIQDIIWDQVQNQLAVQIGEEFIKDNNGQKLDLRKEAHIQTAENFEKGKLATHNRDVDYQERYTRWQDNFTTNKKGERVLKSDAREFFDKGRDKGSGAVHKDHTVSIKEQLNDIEMSTFFSKEEVKEFANSSKNLHDLDASANMSKGDKTMKEFLDSERNGLKPDERFNIDRKQLEKDDREAREELHKRKKENKEKAIQSGKKSRRNEALKVSGKALKAALLQLLSEFLRELISKFISWLKDTERNLSTFIEKIKEAIISFVNNLSNHLLNVGKSVVTMIASAIVGPVINTFLKAWTFIHQGWRSLKEAIDYLNNPENKEKSVQIMMLEIGKIVVAGLSATGAIVVGEALGASLTASFPVLAISIPLLGTIGSVIGTFMGATLSGIIGAFVLKMIDQQIVEKQIAELSSEKIDQKNEMIVIQDRLLDVKSIKLQVEKDSVINTIKERHDMAASIMKEKLSDIFAESTRDDKSDFDEIDALLQELLD